MVAIQEKAFDSDHPTLATSYSNLATVERDLGNHSQARELLQRTISIQENAFDPDHPTLATSYNNLGHVELAEGNKLEACRLFRRAYDILTKHFSASHPNVKTVREAIEKNCGETEQSG